MSEAIPVALALDEFLGDLRLQARASTARVYGAHLKPLRVYFASLKYNADGEVIPGYLHELTPAICRELARERQAALSPNSLRQWIAVLHSFSRFCVEKGWCQDFAADIPKPRYSRPIRRYLTPAQARMVWEAARDDYDRLALLLMAGSGLRRAEVCGLRLRDVDFTAGTVRVYGKGRKWREVAVDARALEMMSSGPDSNRLCSCSRDTSQPLLTGNPSDPAVSHASVQAGSDQELTHNGSSAVRVDPRPFVFHEVSACSHHAAAARRYPTTDRIFPFGPNALWNRVRCMGQRASIGDLHPHQLRHLYAQQSLAAGLDAFSLQSALGHSDPATTQLYVEDAQAAISLQRQREIGLGARLFGG